MSLRQSCKTKLLEEPLKSDVWEAQERGWHEIINYGRQWQGSESASH